MTTIKNDFSDTVLTDDYKKAILDNIIHNICPIPVDDILYNTILNCIKYSKYITELHLLCTIHYLEVLDITNKLLLIDSHYEGDTAKCIKILQEGKCTPSNIVNTLLVMEHFPVKNK